MTLVVPPHISEQEVGHYWPDGRWDDAADEDCLWCSILRQYLGAVPGGAPATHAEAEMLRATAGIGPTGPSGSQDGVRGTKARYGWEPTIIASGIASLKQFFKPGMSATVSGKLSNFPSGHRLRRFYPYFTGGHRVWVGNYDGGLFWGDPGAPQGTYSGEKVTWAEVETFVAGGSSHTIAPLATEDEVIPITETGAKVVTATTGAVYYDPATGKAVTKESLASRTNKSFYTSGAYQLVPVNTGGSQKLLGVRSDDPKVSVKDVPAPPVLKPGTYTVQ